MLSIVLLGGLLASCGGGSGSGVPANPLSATYRVTFKTDWTTTTFPTRFPSNRHFSGLVGATHNKNVSFWQPGSPATEGIRNMAELGSKTRLLAEVDAAKSAGHVLDSLSGGGISSGDTEASLTFTVDPNFPLVTLVSMVAPSPDWFVGVHDLELFSNGIWKDRIDVNLEVYDAGTDDGRTFTSADIESNPHAGISLLSSDPADTDLAQGIHRSSGKHIATYTFERL